MTRGREALPGSVVAEQEPLAGSELRLESTRFWALSPPPSLGAPHLARFSRDVGYRRPSPQTSCGLHNSTGVPYVRTSVARISYYAALSTTTHAAFSQRKPHEVAQRHQPRQEIRDTWAENDGRSPTTAFSSGPHHLFIGDVLPSRIFRVTSLRGQKFLARRANGRAPALLPRLWPIKTFSARDPPR